MSCSVQPPPGSEHTGSLATPPPCSLPKMLLRTRDCPVMAHQQGLNSVPVASGWALVDDLLRPAPAGGRGAAKTDRAPSAPPPGEKPNRSPFWSKAETSPPHASVFPVNGYNTFSIQLHKAVRQAVPCGAEVVHQPAIRRSATPALLNPSARRASVEVSFWAEDHLPRVASVRSLPAKL